MVDRTEVDIDVSVNGTSSLQRAADALASVNNTLRDTARLLNTAVNGFDKLERGLAQAARQGKNASAAINKSLAQYSTASFNQTPPRNAKGQFVSQDFVNQVEARKASEAQAKATLANITANRALEHNQQQLANSNRVVTRSYFEAAFAGEKYKNFVNGTDQGLRGLVANIRNGTSSIESHTKSLSQLSYSLYDVGRNYALLSAGVLAGTALSVKAAADFESAFTGVERTLDAAGTATPGALESVRQGLIDLSTQIPVTYQDVTKIATLGNQLGIASGDIEEFTRVTSEFSTVTGISVDETAQAFGLLGNLLKIGADEYSNLGSSIALVGKNSVATEPQIISVAEQIAAGATGAGFAADEVIGLSAALASLKVPPEQSRGSLSIYFNAINKAVAEGGPALQNFATITGLTTAQIDQLVRSGTGGEEVFRAFINGLNKTDSVGITTALDELGLSQVRVDNTFRRLQQGTEIYASTQDDAAQGFSENTELSRQYAIVLDDLNTQFQLLVNSLNALVAEATSGAVPGIAAFVAEITKMVNETRNFIALPVVKVIVTILGVITTGIGLMLAYQAAVALATAATARLVVAQQLLASEGIATGVKGLIGLMGLLNTGQIKATISALTLGGAIKAVGKATVILALVGLVYDLTFGFDEASKSIKDFANGFGSMVGGFKSFKIVSGQAAGATIDFATAVQFAIAPLQTMLQLLGQVNAFKTATENGKKLGNVAAKGAPQITNFGDAIKNAGNAAGGAGKQVRTLVDYANDLAEVGSRASDIRFGSTDAIDQVRSKFIDLNAELEEYRIKVLQLTSDKAIQEYFLSVANAYGDNLRAGEITAELAQINKDLADAQVVTNKTLVGNSKAAITNRSTIVGLVGQYRDYIEALGASGADQATLNAAVAQSKADFYAQATALGFATGELVPYAAAFDDLTFAINNVPRNVTINADVNPAVTAIRELLARVSSGSFGSGSLPLSVNTPAAEASGRIAGEKSGSAFAGAFGSAVKKISIPGIGKAGERFTFNYSFGAAYAAGGRIAGPGTNTSDSVPIMASNNEYMMRASSASKLGTPLLNYMNKYGSLPGFAQGGQVAPSNVIAQLSPTDRAIFRNGSGGTGDIVIQIDGREIARAVNTQNTRAGYMGAN